MQQNVELNLQSTAKHYTKMCVCAQQRWVGSFLLRKTRKLFSFSPLSHFQVLSADWDTPPPPPILKYSCREAGPLQAFLDRQEEDADEDEEDEKFPGLQWLHPAVQQENQW